MPKLFLLRPSFQDQRLSETQLFYCPHCAMIEGVINYYPELKEKVDIIYVDFKRPRPALVALIGEENQGCPNLVLEKDEVWESTIDFSEFQEAGKYLFTNSKYAIATFFSQKYGTPQFHP